MTEAYEIGPLLLDTDACVVTRAGVPIPLGKRAVAVLSVLVRSAPNYVAKSAIIEAAWPGVIVEEGNLAVQILAIRRALADVPCGDRWVETLARRGYRFSGPVARLPESPASDAADTRARLSLPEPLTSFIGRDREVTEVLELMSRNRVLTLTGTGGVGKTRLAIRAAGAVSGDYGDGACLVELAPLRDPDLVPQAVASALGLKEQPGRRLAETLIDHLRLKHLLLVLDNAEHLLAACAQLVDALVRECPDVATLVTSRERLGIRGEATYRVPSLSIPGTQSDADAESVVDCESVRLFEERVRLHRPHFAVTDQNSAAIANICRRLDGIALAIELAAARVRSMSIEDINRRLDQRLAVLSEPSRTLPLRQQTLRAAIDWSFDLLSEPEKALFCATSAFVGGFTLEAAEQVCAGETVEAREVLELAAALVDKSLVVVEECEGTTRYRLLETVQQYAEHRLHALPDAATCYERHLAYFLALANEAEPHLTGSDQQAWLDRLDTEHDNLRAALQRSSAMFRDGERGLQLACAVARFWLVRGYLAEGRGWFAKLLAVGSNVIAATRARALNWSGILAWKQGDYPAADAFYEQSIAIRRELGDRKGVGAVLNNQGLLAYEQGDYRSARLLHEDSLSIDRELGDRWGIAVSLIHLASLAMIQGDHVSARALNDESLAIFRELDDRTHVANAIRSLGNLHSRLGDHDAARALYDESLAICRDLGDRSGIAGALHGLGVTARHGGDPAQASALLQESLRIYRELRDREATAKALGSLGQLAAARGDSAGAYELHCESLAIYRQLKDRFGMAGAMQGLAAACARRDPKGAARLWGAVERMREELGAPLAPSERPDHDRSVADARAACGHAAFDDAWRHGRSIDVEQALASTLQRLATRVSD